MRSRFILTTLIGGLTLGVASCGSKDSTATPTSPTTSSSTPAGPAAATASITIPRGTTAFTPANATIAVGGTVTWKNDDTVDHNSTASAWSAQLAPGAQFTRTFAAAGAFPYVCTLHAGMTGTITVQ